MLVTISDLHLHDSTLTQAPESNSFHQFAERLAEMARHASWRAGGRYRPLESIDLVLLGDTLDITNSALWLEDEIRPWSDLQDRSTTQRVAEVVQGIVRANHEGLRVLRALAVEGAIRIPAAMDSPLSMKGRDLVQVPVRIHYMVGDADWYLHVPGSGLDFVRQQVALAVGLCTPHQSGFAHDPLDSDELAETLSQHRIVARHGDVFDPLAFSEDRCLPSLSDAIQLELIARFGLESKAPLLSAGAAELANRLDELTTLRPQLHAAIWLDCVLERSCPAPGLRRRIKQVWDKLVDRLLESPVVREQHNLSSVNLIDGLAKALKFNQRWGGNWTDQVDQWLDALSGTNQLSLAQRALDEPEFRNRQARHVVYGHTHQAEHRVLETNVIGQRQINQNFFNSGSWQRSYLPTIASGQHQDFVAQDQVTVTAFYLDDERSGRGYETWSTKLASAVPPGSLRANDGALGEEQSADQASFIGRPHFSTAHSLSKAARNGAAG